METLIETRLLERWPGGFVGSVVVLGATVGAGLVCLLVSDWRAPPPARRTPAQLPQLSEIERRITSGLRVPIRMMLAAKRP